MAPLTEGLQQAGAKSIDRCTPVCTTKFHCRGRCLHRPAQIAPVLREFSANSLYFLGRQSRRPLRRPPALSCRGGRLCPPAECTGFTEICGKFATSQRADVGIGPYRTAANPYCPINPQSLYEPCLFPPTGRFFSPGGIYETGILECQRPAGVSRQGLS